MSTIDLTPTCIWPVAAELGEGPIWMGGPGRVWLVDILGRQVHCCSEQGLHRQSWPMPLPVGFVLPLAGGKGDFVVGLKGHLQRFNPVSGLLTHLLDVEPEIPTNRINDGHVDAQGRLWFGTMDMRASKPTGQLYRLTQSGSLLPQDGPYAVTNGPALSPDGLPPVPASQTPWQEIYRSTVGQLEQGACMELALPYQRIAEKLPRHNH